MKLRNILKKNLISNEIIIGMGAGAFSKVYGRIKKYFMSFDQELIKKFNNNISNDTKTF